MFENLKLKLARIIVRKKYLKKNLEPIVFNKIITDAQDFFVIMPESDVDFYNAHDLLKYLIIHRKNVTLFLPEHKYNLMPEKDKYKFISFNLLEKTKLFLPDQNLTERLKNKLFDVVIDLNRKENIFFSAVANIVNSKLRISFTKENSESYYNFQFAGSTDNSEVAFRNLLNFLQMF
jgi:hypothetical protein